MNVKKLLVLIVAGTAIAIGVMAVLASGSARPGPSPSVPATSDAVSSAAIQPTQQPSPTISLPTSYATLTGRDWAKVVKAPGNYVGKGYKLWGCISQFDAATGPDSFRAWTSYRKETSWALDGVNAFFNGDATQLADFVQSDVVAMSVVGAGSYSYDTQAGGNATAPAFVVVKIQRLKGSC